MFIEDFELSKNVILVGVYTPEESLPNYIVKLKEFKRWLEDTFRLSTEINFIDSNTDMTFEEYWEKTSPDVKKQDLLNFIISHQ